jgi:hypothetical protein
MRFFMVFAANCYSGGSRQASNAFFLCANKNVDPKESPLLFMADVILCAAA